jgi:SAM-dependent methyltransferase
MLQNMTEHSNKLRWVYDSENNSDLTQRYEEWASDYDRDIVAKYGYIGPRVTTQQFERYVPKTGKVLDAGAGTGLVGQELYRLGYHDIEGMDMSPAMLDEARRKNVYGKLHQMVMGEPLDYPSNNFDATICVGVLTVGHANAEALEEFVRVTRPGGKVIFMLRQDVYMERGFREKQDDLEFSEMWQRVSVTKTFKALPIGEPDMYHNVWTYMVK